MKLHCTALVVNCRYNRTHATHLPLEHKVIRDPSNKTDHTASNNDLVMIDLLYKAYLDGRRHRRTVLPRVRPYPMRRRPSGPVSHPKQCAPNSQLVRQNLMPDNSIAEESLT